MKAKLKSFYFLDGIADFLEGGYEVVKGGLSAIVDDGDGLLGDGCLDLLGAFDKADVALDLVLATLTVHHGGRCYYKRVSLGLCEGTDEKHCEEC